MRKRRSPMPAMRRLKRAQLITQRASISPRPEATWNHLAGDELFREEPGSKDMAEVLDQPVETEQEPRPRATVPPPDEHEPDEIPRRPFYKRPLVLLIGAVVLLLALVFGLRYYLYARAHESTDDAF